MDDTILFILWCFNCLYFSSTNKFKKIKRFFIIICNFFYVSLFSYAYISITETDKRTDYPGKEIATKVQYAWNKDHEESINVVLGDEWVAGNLSYHLKSRPSWEGQLLKIS